MIGWGKMKSLSNFSGYTKSLIAYNLVIILLFSALFFDIWGKSYPPYFDNFFFLEVFVAAATISIYLYWLLQLSKSGIGFKKLIPVLSFISIFLYAEGQHASANQIRGFVDSPSALFFDEYLSHWTFMTAVGFIGMAFSYLHLLEKKMSTSVPEVLSLVISGLIQGSIIGLYAVEGRSGWIAGSISILALILTYKWLKKRKLSNYPLVIYYATAYSAALFILGLWFIQHGGFLEPSVIGFGRF